MKLIKRIKQSLPLFFMVCLVGCQSTYSRDYLLSHPQILQKEASQCEGKSDAYCLMVQSALSRFIELINLRSEDPVQFGQQILIEQRQLSLRAEAYRKAQVELDQMKKSNPSTVSSNQVLERYQAAQRDYKAQQQKVAELLDIVSATSSPN